jgi:hypothetical protein
MTRHHSLPIPTLLSCLILVLPFTAGLALEILTLIQERRQIQRRAYTSPLSLRSYILTIFLLIVYETVVATLIGTHIGPTNTLTCGLEERVAVDVWPEAGKCDSDYSGYV